MNVIVISIDGFEVTVLKNVKFIESANAGDQIIVTDSEAKDHTYNRDDYKVVIQW